MMNKFDGKRSFSFDQNKFSRSGNSRLVSEIGSSVSARFTAYEKLSDSMRMADDVASTNNHGRRSKNGVLRFVNKIFSLKKGGSDSSETRAEKTSVRTSSWRPDPNSRWPVQGW